ncbi:MAG: hypothetical protein M1275_02550 [Patescibacteria group bacterium]|nr:hypothetical protein [Patescibacteria group bacterium]
MLLGALMFRPVSRVSPQEAKVEPPVAGVKLLDPRLEKLNKFFDEYHCKQPNYAEHYLAASDKNGIDWRLLPAISIIESQCGKHQRFSNWWGWNSAATGFGSVDEGIDFVAGQLGSGRYYGGRTTLGKLRSYNPHPDYPQKVLTLMDDVDENNANLQR